MKILDNLGLSYLVAKIKQLKWGNANITNNSITSDKLVNDSVTSNKILDGAITMNKLDPTLSSKINSIDQSPSVDLTNYVTTSKLEDTLNNKNYLTQHQTVTLDKTNDLNYTLKVAGQNAGTISIPQDRFLKDASYSTLNGSLTLTFIVEGSDDITVEVPMPGVDGEIPVYSAGNGLKLENNSFSIKLANTSATAPLSISSEGLALNLSTYYTKTECDNLYVKNDSIANYVLKSTYDTFVTSTNSAIETLNTASQNHITSNELNAKLNDYALTSSIPNVPSWALSTNKPSYNKSEIGLGNVGNFKAVSTVAGQGLSTTEKNNARLNIGAGTSNFSGNYTDLTNKPSLYNPTIMTEDDYNALGSKDSNTLYFIY